VVRAVANHLYQNRSPFWPAANHHLALWVAQDPRVLHLGLDLLLLISIPLAEGIRVIPPTIVVAADILEPHVLHQVWLPEGGFIRRFCFGSRSLQRPWWE
jgi:hypothetical protein